MEVWCVGDARNVVVFRMSILDVSQKLRFKNLV